MRLLLLWLLLVPVQAFAQEKTPEQMPERQPFTLKIAPAALLNFIQQTVFLQADIPFSRRWGLDMGAGIVLNSFTFSAFKGESYTGLKLKPALKYYTKPSFLGNGYASLVLKYNNLHSDRYVNIIRQGGQYTEWLLQRRHIITYGVAMQIGAQNYFGKDKRWVIESFIGLGVRYQQITRRALPPDTELVTEEGFFNFERDPGNYRVPDFMMGVYLGRVLGKSK